MGLTDEELAENERLWAEENGKSETVTTDSSGELRGAGISAAGIESDLGNLSDEEAPPEVGAAPGQATPGAGAPVPGAAAGGAPATTPSPV